MAVTQTEVLSYEVRDKKAYIAMRRPQAMNALNRELMKALSDAFSEADQDDDVFVVILTGEGGRAFSAGGDLKEAAIRVEGGQDIADDGPTRSKAMRAHPKVAKGGAMPGFDEINDCSKPVIAAIEGYCLAGGHKIAPYCDFRLATRKSTFAMPEPRRN